MLQRRRDGWASDTAAIQCQSAGFRRTYIHKEHLIQEQTTPLTQCLFACLFALLLHVCLLMHTILLCSLYMHTIPLPPGMLCNNPFSLRLAPLMPCIALVISIICVCVYIYHHCRTPFSWTVLHAHHSPYFSLSHHSQDKAGSQSLLSRREVVSCECVSWCSDEGGYRGHYSDLT